MTPFFVSTLQLYHRVAPAPNHTRQSNRCSSRHQASRATYSADTPEDTVKSPNLVNKLLLNAASLLNLDRSTAHCIHCKGSGFELCSSCKGSGIHGIHASGGLETNRCLTCHGRGTCQCRHCQGKGRR